MTSLSQKTLGVTPAQLSDKVTWGRVWGELADDPEIGASITKLTPAEMFIPKPYTLQGTHDDTPDHAILRPSQDSEGGNVVLHCIDLIRHNRLIDTQNKKLHRKIMKTRGECEMPSLPVPPNEFCQQIPPNAPTKQSTNIKLCPVPSISQKTANVLLRKVTASILCYIGYTTSMSDAFEVMSDCLGEYLSEFCVQLRRQQDNVLMGHRTKYSDVFEETLYAQGIQGYEEFVHFVTTFTTQYVRKLDDRRQIIESEYSVLCKIPDNAARSMPGHLPHVNTVNLLKGSFETDMTEQETDVFTNDVFIHEPPNGFFFGRS